MRNATITGITTTTISLLLLGLGETQAQPWVKPHQHSTCYKPHHPPVKIIQPTVIQRFIQPIVVQEILTPAFVFQVVHTGAEDQTEEIQKLKARVNALENNQNPNNTASSGLPTAVTEPETTIQTIELNRATLLELKTKCGTCHQYPNKKGQIQIFDVTGNFAFTHAGLPASKSLLHVTLQKHLMPPGALTDQNRRVTVEARNDIANWAK